MGDAPHRAVEVVIKITADSDADIASALHQIRTEMALRYGLIQPCVTGGYSSSWTITVERRPEQTHDKWWADLQAYLPTLDAALKDTARDDAGHERKGKSYSNPMNLGVKGVKDFGTEDLTDTYTNDAENDRGSR